MSDEKSTESIDEKKHMEDNSIEKETEEEGDKKQDDAPDNNNEIDENDAEAEGELDNKDEEKVENTPDDNDEIEESNEIKNDSESETAEEEKEENDAEAEGELDNKKEEKVENTPDDNDEIEEKSKDKNTTDTSKREKIFKILKWSGIVSVPLIIVAALFLLQPTIITNLFSKSEPLLLTPKTAAIQWTAEEMEIIKIVGQTLAETEKIWSTIFTQKGGLYRKPDFTVFTDRIASACVDTEKKESGPIVEPFSLGTFYCPAEKRIYIDLSLHLDLKNRLDIPGDFAQGYIVAHEIGHHVQNLAKISQQIPGARAKLNAKEFNMVLQRIELQADCFAGIWAKQTAEQQYKVKPDEFADALNAVTEYAKKHHKEKKANDIMPDPFTHSSSRLRIRWFTIGYDKGTFDSCDTFTTVEL